MSGLNSKFKVPAQLTAFVCIHAKLEQLKWRQNTFVYKGT